MPQVSLEFL